MNSRPSAASRPARPSARASPKATSPNPAAAQLRSGPSQASTAGKSSPANHSGAVSPAESFIQPACTNSWATNSRSASRPQPSVCSRVLHAIEVSEELIMEVSVEVRVPGGLAHEVGDQGEPGFFAQACAQLGVVGLDHLAGTQVNEVAVHAHAGFPVACGHHVAAPPHVVVEVGFRHRSSWL